MKLTAGFQKQVDELRERIEKEEINPWPHCATPEQFKRLLALYVLAQRDKDR